MECHFEQKITKIDRAYANMKIKKNDWYKEDHGNLISFTAIIDNEEMTYLTTKKAYEEDWKKQTLIFRDHIAKIFQKQRLERQRRK
mgnify:CR=1 FL=1